MPTRVETLSPDWNREQDGAVAQAMLAAIVENSNTAIIGCALDGTILSWNAAAERMFGWSAREAIAQSIAIITPQQQSGLLQPLLDQAARSEQLGQVESRYLRRDGARIDAAGTVAAIRDAHGDPVFFTLTLWGITHQKQLEREVRKKEQDLRESRKQFEQLAEHIPQAFWITDMHRKELIYLSLAHERIYGRRFSSLRSVWPAWKEAVHADDRERVLAAYREMGSRGLDEQFRIQQPDGALRWVHARGFPVLDANGTVYRVVGTVEDITAAKKSETELRIVNERLQRALDGSNLALFDGDLRTREVYLSEAWAVMLGEDPKPTIDTFENLIMQVHPEEIERVREQFYGVLKGQITAYDMVHRVMSRAGEWKWIHSRAKVVERAKDGRAVRLAGVNADITERVRSEQEIARLNQSLEQRVAERTRQLVAANKELEAFSYSVSHDLRAPLRGIDGFSQLLLKKYADKLDATGNDYLLRIRRASVRMGELIDDLLQLSRVSRSQIKTELLDLSRMTRSILAALREREPERKVKIEVQDDIELSADPRLLRIALENLLGNAWKFTGKREQATIRVGTLPHDGEQAVFVKDNGAGFDIKYAHKLFGAFQRLHGATEFEGTGIGLATVQRIINLHGGRIWADSTLGKGATFYFVIPRALRNETTTA